MAFWNRKKKLPSQIHGGLEYKQGDDMTIDQLNGIVNNSFYAVDFAEAMADAPDISELNGEGTPSVTLIDNPKTPVAGGETIHYKKFKFANLRGPKGNAATIKVGTVTTGAAGGQASVTNSGTENDAKLDFTIPKGQDGASGVTGVVVGTPTEEGGYTVTPVTFRFEQGNDVAVSIKAKNGGVAVSIISATITEVVSA